MASKNPGLRFDIHEQIHLPENAASISELDEVELNPEVEVRVADEYAVVHGQLVLSTRYLGVSENDTRGEENCAFQHRIPLEITVPLGRIENRESVAVDIDHFDVDLKSSRLLNLTGILTLRGLSEEGQEWEQPANEADEDELVFIHTIDRGKAGLQDVEYKITDHQLRRDSSRSQSAEPPDRKEPDESFDIYSSAAQPDDVAETEATAEQETISAVEIEADSNEASDDSPDDDANDTNVVFTEQPTEPKELKIAFNAQKKAEEAESINLVSVFQKKSPANEAPREAKEENEERAEEQISANSTGDDLEWSKILINRGEEEEKFYKMRVCIVQKDETVETIANRYSLNPKEILLFNRLEQDELSAGQLIQIPPVRREKS